MRSPRALLGIEPDEVRPVAFTLLIGFVWGLSTMFSYTSANTLFISLYGSGELAYAFILNALLLPFLGAATLVLARHVTFVRRIRLTIGAFCLVMGALFLLLAHGPWKFPALAYLVWIDVESALGNVLWMAILDRLFTLRQSKRLHAMTGFGTEASYLAGGIAIPFLVPYTGALNLTLIAIALYALVILLAEWMTRSCEGRFEDGGEAPESEGEAGERTSTAALLANRYVLGISAISAVSGLALCFGENAYYDQIQTYLGDEVRIAAFMSFFYTLSSIVAIAVNAIATSWFLRSFGIAAGLIAGPLAAVVGTLAFHLAGSFGSSAALAFAIVAGLRLIKTVYTSSLESSASFILLQAVPARDRDAAMNLTQTVVPHVASGIGGVALLAMTKGFGAATGAFITALGMASVVGVVLSWAVGREYSRNLGETLKSGRLGTGEAPPDDAGTLEALRGMLGDPDPERAALALDMLARAKAPGLRGSALALAGHPAARVRVAAARALEACGEEADVPALEARLATEDDPEAAGAWARALGFASEGAAAERLTPLLSAPDRRLAAGVCVALMKYCGIEGMIVAGVELKRLGQSAEAGERAFAADLIGETGLPGLYQLLIPLLSDAAIPVRRRAIAAAEALNHPKLVPHLLDALRVSELRAAAKRAIVAHADTALPRLERLYEESPEKRRLAAYLAGLIKGPDAVRFLRARLGEPDRRLLADVVGALEACRFAPGAADRARLERILESTVAEAAATFRAELDLAADPASAPAVEALRKERLRLKGLAFSLLALLYRDADVRGARFHCLHAGSDERSGIAVEFIDNLLSKPHKAMVLPLLEDASVETAFAGLRRFLADPAPRGPAERRHLMLADRTVWDGAWLRATLHRAELAGLPEPEAAARLHALLEEEPAVGELLHPPGRGRLTVFERGLRLGKVDFLAALPDEFLALVARSAETRVYADGEPVFRKGDAGDALHIVAEGSVRIHDGDRPIASITEGGIFGELAALHPEARTADATADGPAVVLALARDKVARIMEESVEVARGVIQVLCRRMRGTLAVRPLSARAVEGAPSTPAAAPAGDAPPDLGPVEKMLVLKSVAIFRDLPEETLRDVAGIARGVDLAPGQPLFAKGDAGHAMYIVVSGEVRVHDGPATIARLGPGQILGELAALSFESRTADATALGRTRLLRLTQDLLYELMWERGEVTRGIVQVLVGRMRDMMRVAAPAEPAVGDRRA